MIRWTIQRLRNALALKYTAVSIFELLLVRLGVPVNKKNVPLSYKAIEDQPPKLANIISLSFRNDRRIKLRSQLDALSLDFNFVDAIHGQDINLSLLSDRIISTQSKALLSRGSIGAIMSHCCLWQRLIQQPQSHFLIFEDDIVPSAEFKLALGAIWRELPKDFDIFLLGSGLTMKNNLRRSFSEHIYIPYFPRKGMYAYVISKNGVEKILKLIFPVTITFGGIDTIVGNLIRLNEIDGYHANPSLCQTDLGSPSNIFNRSMADKILHETESI